MLAIAVSFLLALMLGFAAHRASICTVRAVSEVMRSGTGHMAGCILKTVLWVMLITLPFFWVTSSSGPYYGGWQLTATAATGGLLFGLGAGFNGACAYATMARLMDGEGRMLMTISGFALGVALYLGLIDAGVVSRPRSSSTGVRDLINWGTILVPALVLLGVFQIWRILRAEPGVSWRDRVLAPRYRLSSAAMLIGLTGATIYLVYGSAGYSSTYDLLIEGALGARSWPPAGRWIILLGVLLGMLASTLQRGTFRLNLRPKTSWLRNGFGGALMGLGVALAPGGNDTFILYSLPTLSPHALPAFGAMLVGMAVGLVVTRFAFGYDMRVVCRNDKYVSG